MEIWKKIKNTKYEISNLGRVRSDFNKVRILKPRPHSGGYHTVCLCVDKKYIYKYIHRLVAEYFLKSSNFKIINHIDGNKQNNNVNNLEWCSQKHNIKHSYENNLNPNYGNNCKFSKLKYNEVLEIRNLKNSKSLLELSEKYNVTKATISRILNNKIWKQKSADGSEEEGNKTDIKV